MSDGLQKNTPMNTPLSEGPSGAPLIQLKEVSFCYEDVLALNHISLSINRGSMVALTGPNGCGKSTLLRLVNGLIFPETGWYRYDGDVIDDHAMKDRLFAKRLHQRVGFVFQNPDAQLFCPSVHEEIAFGLRQMGLSEKEVCTRTDDLLALFGLTSLQKRAPYHLSGGEKRKVSIACVIALNPETIVLDEPTNGLDEEAQAWLLAFLRSLTAQGKTVVIATHHREAVEALSAREVHLSTTHRP